jgi:GNAT superfamily N-acetyltransferase
MVRLASREDFLAMVEVINSAFAVETFLEGTRTDVNRLAEIMEKGEFLLAHDDADNLVASVYVEVRGTRGYFGMLAVLPSHQNQGLGRAMVQAAEEHCRQRGCTRMDLTTLSLRPELPKFYSRLGYTETGTEEFHPSRPLQPGVECHCILMSKTL